MNPSSSVILVIPARYGSTRFPGKPLVDLRGKPMVQHVHERCRASKLAVRCIVATDDTNIADVVRSFGGEVRMTDPDLSSGTERVAAVAREIDAEIVVNVQGDEPLIPPSTIDAVIHPLLDQHTFDIATAACPIQTEDEYMNPNVVKVVCRSDDTALYFSRAPIPHNSDTTMPASSTALRHIGIYAFRKEALLRFASLPATRLERTEQLEQLRALDAGMIIYVARVASGSPAVDTPADVPAVLAYMDNG